MTRLAAEIRRDYEGKSPLLIAVLKGSFIFLSDLVREIAMPLVAFVEVRSYQGTGTMGRVRLLRGHGASVRGSDVLLVEDIMDTGATSNYIIRSINASNPASLGLCAPLDKPSRRCVPVQIDYLGFTVPDQFLVGYGLNVDERYRHLPDVYVLEE